MENVIEIFSDFATDTAKWMAIILLIYGATMIVKIAIASIFNQIRKLIGLR